MFFFFNIYISYTLIDFGNHSLIYRIIILLNANTTRICIINKNIYNAPEFNSHFCDFFFLTKMKIT